MRRIAAPHEIRGVLFDKDGTLIDYMRTWGPINRAVALFAANGDVGIAGQLLRAGGHDPDTNAIAAGSPLAGGGVAEIAQIFADILCERTPLNLEREIDRIFSEGGALSAVAIEGVHAAVRAIRARGIAVGVATNDTLGGLRASLGRIGMADDFDFVVASDSGYGAKPEPGMALAFARHMRLDTSVIAVVGDSIHDLEMARGAACGLAIAVLSGTSGHDDLSDAADIVTNSVADLPELFGCSWTP